MQLHESKIFFWRSQQNIDLAIHENREEGVIIVSTRSFETGTVYPAIFVEECKLPFSRQDISKAVDDKVYDIV
jgi:hypothetical protein